MVSYPGDTIFGGEDSLKTDDMFRFDDFFHDTFGKIAGIDEAGRGSLAGPVVAAAVILENSSIPVRDSKELNFSEREDIFRQIVSTSKVGIGLATPEEIDVFNIFQATRLAMNRALENLGDREAYPLIDGKNLRLSRQGSCVIKGDAKSASIAAASIVAKVIRDRIMISYHKVFPMYMFYKNKGYATAEHKKFLCEYGPTVIHRLTYEPVLSAIRKRGSPNFKITEISLRRFESINKKLGRREKLTDI